jgi:serine/threonine-protein kinase
MSPEQVEGKETDRRSDIYSLGVIMFEMITGRLPFNGDNPLSIVLKHKTEAPPDPRDFNAQVPLEFTRVILRCMEKNKDKRFQDAKELHSELSNIEKEISSEERPIPKKMTTVSNGVKSTFTKRWISVAALFLVIVVAGIAGLYLNKEAPVLPSGQKMLVVLPLKNLGAPADEYFADGITEEITSRLTALQGLGVISRTSANRYKNANKTIKQIGEELDVDYILEGAVRWDRSSGGNGRVRVTSQLIRVSDDTHLWSERYDRVINDIFSVQSEIAEEVASQLDLTVLSPERKVLSTSPTDNLEAYDSYMRGIEHMNRGWRYSAPQEFEKAVKLFEKATELDPSFALAYANLSIVHSRTYFFGLDQTEERLNRSRAAADRALELKPDLPDAHQALALYYYWGLLDYDRAAEVFETLKKSWPNFSGELPGYILRRQGKWEQALETLERAFKLNPFFSQLAYEIGGAYLSMRRYEKADEWFDRTLSINPDLLMPKLQKIGIYILSKGSTKKARALLETLSQHPFTDYMWFTLGMLERDYQGVLDRLASLPYDSFKEQHFYFHKDLAYTSAYHAMKEVSSAKTHAESARIVLEKAMDEHSGDSRFHAALGLTYAYLGRKDDAIREGNHATTLYPVTKDAALGPVYILNLAKIYSLVGEYDEAIETLNISGRLFLFAP